MSSTTGFKRKCSNASVVSEKVIQDAAAALEFKSPSVPFWQRGRFQRWEAERKDSQVAIQKTLIFYSPL
jgi:hypothetical protein